MRWQSSAVVLAAAVTLATAGPAAQTPLDVQTLLTRVGDKLADYYKRAESLVCIEKTVVQPISSSFSPSGFARTTEAELRIEPELDADGDGGATNAKVVRQLMKINGKPPREKDKKDRAGCTDPNPLTTEPLAFLLPTNRDGYTFTSGGLGKGKESGSYIIDFKAASEDKEGKVEEDARGHGRLLQHLDPDADPRPHLDRRADVSGPAPRTAPRRAGRNPRRVGATAQAQPARLDDDGTLRHRHPLPSDLVHRSRRSAAAARVDRDRGRLALGDGIDAPAAGVSGYRRFLTAGRIIK